MRYQVWNAIELNKALDMSKPGDVIALGGDEIFELDISRYDHSTVSDIGFTSIDLDNPSKIGLAKIHDVSGIHFDGVVFDANGDVPRGRALIQLKDVSDITITNSEMVGYADAPFLGGRSAADMLVARNVDGLIFEGNVSTGFNFGLSIFESTNVSIAGNDLSELQGDPIQLAGVQNVVIDDNHVHDLLGSHYHLNHMDMIQVWSAGATLLTSNLTITNNLLDSGDGAGAQSILIGNQNHKDNPIDALLYKNILVENNVLHNGHLHGVSVYGSDGVVIKNNTMLTDFDAPMIHDESKQVVLDPELRVLDGSKNVVITGNVTSKVVNTDPKAVISGNLIVDYDNPKSDAYYAKLYEDPASGDFRVVSGSLADTMGAGANLAAKPVTDSAPAVIADDDPVDDGVTEPPQPPRDEPAEPMDETPQVDTPQVDAPQVDTPQVDTPQTDEGSDSLTVVNGRYFVDSNENNLGDADETGAAGIQVQLFQRDTVIATTTTDKDGSYSLAAQFDGHFHVKFDVGDAAIVRGNYGGNDARDSDAWTVEDGLAISSSFFAEAGAVVSHVDVGVVAAPDIVHPVAPSEDEPDQSDPVVSDTGTVWGTYFSDLDQNRLHSDQDGGIAAAKVALYQGRTKVAETTTDANGNYSFEASTGAYYSVQFESVFGYDFVAGNVGSNDAIDSDVWGTNKSGYGQTGHVKLGANGNVRIDAGAARNEDFVSALVADQPEASVSGHFFIDMNGNSLADAGEGAVANAVVKVVQRGVEIDRTLTDENGDYAFFDLARGTYEIHFERQDGNFVRGNMGQNDQIDSDVWGKAQDGAGLTTVFIDSQESRLWDIDAGVYELNLA